MTDPLITFSSDLKTVDSLGDADLLTGIGWSPVAPAFLVEAAATGKSEEFMAAWQKYLATRMKPAKKLSTTNGKLATQKNQQSKPTSKLREALASFSRANEKKSKQNGKVTGSKQQPNQLLADAADELRAEVAKGTHISRDDRQLLIDICSASKQKCDKTASFRLWRAALLLAIDSSQRLENLARKKSSNSRNVLSEAEWTWASSLLFEAIAGASEIRDECQRRFNEELLESTDGDGTPHASLLANFEEWVSPLTSAAVTASQFNTSLWDEEAAERFESLLVVSAQLTHANGRLSTSDAESQTLIQRLARGASISGLKKSHPARRYLDEIEQGPKVNGKRKAHLFDEPPSNQSDWAHLACLRNDWTRRANSLVVSHHGDNPVFELATRGHSLLRGEWETEIQLDGEPVETTGIWSCVCWFSDTDADYLELQLETTSGIRIDRMFLLSRSDDFAILADSINGAGDQRVDYTSRLPVVEGVEIESAVPTRECLLKRKKLRVRALPLGLPDDRVLSTSGGFGPYSNQLILKQASAGQGLVAPIVFDWSPSRKRAPSDWSQLTVAEDGRILKHGEAAGHRLRLGDHQLVLYRSLQKSPHARTVLGHHTFYETVIGEFDTNGEVEPIVVVE